jgi:serine/threonine protein kinase/Tfp pilus assembly protein PilF
VVDENTNKSALFSEGDQVFDAAAFTQDGRFAKQYYLVDKVRAVSKNGEIYLCRLFPGELPVTLKVMRSQLPKDKILFRHEAAISLIVGNHPNAVYCLTVESTPEVLALVLERPSQGPGVDLAEWVGKSTLTPRKALGFTLDVCRGLRHANSLLAGFVHRDIKPENVLVAPSEYQSERLIAKISDFGLAIYNGLDQSTSTIVNETLRAKFGSRPYMAPEQWTGETVDVRTDIYAVGIMLFELLVGRTPFVLNYSPRSYEARQRAEIDWRRMHQEDPPPALPTGFAALEPIVSECLRKDPNERPQDLEVLLTRLEKSYHDMFGIPPQPDPGRRSPTAGTSFFAGVGLSRVGKPDQAIGFYNEALSLRPNDPLTLYNQGIAFSATNQEVRAVRAYDEALAIIRTSGVEQLEVSVQVNRANSLTALGRIDEAMESYENAIALRPDDAVPYFSRAWGYNMAGNYHLALADYQRCTELQPQFYLAYSDRGLLLHQLGQYDEAKKSLERAVEIKPDFAAGYFHLANTCVKLGDDEEALHYYGKALENDPFHIRAATNLGNLYYKMGDEIEALENFSYAVARDPTFSQGYWARCFFCYRTKRYEQGYEDLLQVLSSDRDNAEKYFERLRELGDARVIKDVDRATNEMQQIEC